MTGLGHMTADAEQCCRDAETAHCLIAHRAAIDKLRQQNAKLKEELLLENKFSVRPSNPGATALINKLQDEADMYTRKVKSPMWLCRVFVRSAAATGRGAAIQEAQIKQQAAGQGWDKACDVVLT